MTRTLLDREHPELTPRQGTHRRRRSLAFLWAKRVVVCMLIAVVAAPALVALRTWYVGQQDARPPSDVIIVLGAAQYNGDPSEVFRARLDHAAELYHDGVASRIVTVGSSLPGDNYTEAGAGKRWLSSHAEVPQEDVLAIPHGRDTLQSLHAVDGVMEQQGWGSAVIVTDPWHSLRSRTMARVMGMEAATSPARDNNPLVGSFEAEARYIARETAAYFYYILFRGNADFGP